MEPGNHENPGSQRHGERQRQQVDPLGKDLPLDELIDDLQHDPGARSVRRSELRHVAVLEPRYGALDESHGRKVWLGESGTRGA